MNEAKRKSTIEPVFTFEAYTQAIIENALDAIVVMNAEGVITAWNPQSEKIFGWTRDEAIGKKMSETIIPLKYRTAHERGLKHFLNTGEGPIMNKRIEMSALHRDGHEFPIELSVTSTRIGENRLFSAFIRDITERKEAEAELKKMNEELIRLNQIKSEFTSMVSHELRTPLNAVKEGIDLVLDGIDGPVTPAQKDTLNISKNSVDRLNRLINNVLDYSKLESGKIQLHYDKTNLNELLADVYNLMKPEADKKALNYFLEVPKNPVYADIDADQIRQVIINLIHNALKFTEGGQISIGLSNSSELVRIEIKDTGSGIRKEDHHKIFEMFTQAPYRGMWKTGGSGVGLAVCKLIVDLHHGQIAIESEPGRGSTFVVTLPITPQRNLIES